MKKILSILLVFTFIFINISLIVINVRRDDFSDVMDYLKSPEYNDTSLYNAPITNLYYDEAKNKEIVVQNIDYYDNKLTDIIGTENLIFSYINKYVDIPSTENSAEGVSLYAMDYSKLENNEFFYKNLFVLDGGEFPTAENEVMISKAVMEEYAVNIGDTVMGKYKVVGVYSPYKSYNIPSNFDVYNKIVFTNFPTISNINSDNTYYTAVTKTLTEDQEKLILSTYYKDTASKAKPYKVDYFGQYKIIYEYSTGHIVSALKYFVIVFIIILFFLSHFISKIISKEEAIVQKYNENNIKSLVKYFSILAVITLVSSVIITTIFSGSLTSWLLSNMPPDVIQGYSNMFNIKSIIGYSVIFTVIITSILIVINIILEKLQKGNDDEDN